MTGVSVKVLDKVYNETDLKVSSGTKTRSWYEDNGNFYEDNVTRPNFNLQVLKGEFAKKYT